MNARDAEVKVLQPATPVTRAALWLVIAHLLVFNGLFVWRVPAQQVNATMKQWQDGTFSGGPLAYVSLYMSYFGDEMYYYRWSSAVLGRAIEADLPSPGFDEDPEVRPGQPRLPYRDIAWEYPPFSVPLVVVARLISWDYLSYTRALAGLLSLVLLGSLAVALRIARRLPVSVRPSAGWLFGGSLLIVLAIGPLYVTRLDLLPVLLLLLALDAFLGDYFIAAALWLALGVLTKGYLVAVAPIFAALLYRRSRSALVSFTGAFVSVILAISLAALVWSRGGYWDTLRFHAYRGIQIESLYALWPFAMRIFFGAHAAVVHSHGAFEIRGSGDHALRIVASVAPLLLSLWLSFRTFKAPEPARVEVILRASLLAVMAFILTFKVLSPQFFIWLSHLVLLSPPRRHALGCFALVIVVDFLGQLIFPLFYELLRAAHPLAFALLFARNAGLVWLFVWLWRDWTVHLSSAGILSRHS